MRNASAFYFPEDFLRRLRESYKYFFYKTLIDLTKSPGEHSQLFVIASMVSNAWPIVISNGISLGKNEFLEDLCFKISNIFNTNGCPSVNDIAKELGSGHYDKNIKEISKVFYRFGEAWLGRRYEKEFFPYELSFKIKAPYFVKQTGTDTVIVLQDYWIDYCDKKESECVALFVKQTTAFLERRNRYSDATREGLKNAFYWYYSSASQLDSDDSLYPGVSNENYRILEEIPVSFIFKDPPLVPKIGDFRTFFNIRPRGIKTVADILSLPTDRKRYLFTVKQYVIAEHSRLIYAYNYYKELPIIPQALVFGASLSASLKSFIHAYIDRLRLRNSFLEGKEKERMELRLRTFSSMYDDRIYDDSSRSSIAAELGIHPERVRQIVFGQNVTIGAAPCGKYLNGLSVSEDFIVNPILQAQYIELSSSGIVAEPLESFMLRLGDIDQKTFRFLLDSLDLHEASSLRYLEPFIIKGEHISFINRVFGSVMKFFSDEVTYISLEESFLPFIKEKTGRDFNDPSLDVLLEIVKHSGRFESKIIGGRVLYALKWQYLNTVPSRLARVLFDIGDVVHYSIVYEEYNRRALQYNLPLETIDGKFSPRLHPYIRTQGKTGNWYFQKEDEFSLGLLDGTKSLMTAIKDFILQSDGQVTAIDTENHLKSLGYIVNQKSLKTYLSHFCRASQKERGLYIYKEWIERFPEHRITDYNSHSRSKVIPIVIRYLENHDNKARTCDLISEYNASTGLNIRHSTMGSILDRRPDLFERYPEGGKKYYKLRVSPEEAMSFQESIIPSKEPEYRPIIKKAILEQLNSTREKCLKMNDLVNSVSHLIPRGLNRNIIYKILKRMVEIEIFFVDGKRYVRLHN